MTQSNPVLALEATRVGDDGSKERAEFRGREGERMLVHVNLPAGPPRGAVVICSPLLGEFMRNYRREVLLARRLSELGFAALRFHYRFTGNSDGEDESLSFDTMRQDAIDCCGLIRDEAPTGPLFVLGTRWGALIAATAASARPEAGLVLWEPLFDTARFFKEAFRNRLVKDMRDGVENPQTGKQLEEQLRAGEAVEVPAHRLQPELFRSSAGRSLVEELGPAPRQVLAVQIGPTGTVRADLVRQAERWRAAGYEVDTESVHGEENWWLVDERWHDEAKRPMTRELISLATRWIDAHAPEGGTR